MSGKCLLKLYVKQILTFYANILLVLFSLLCKLKLFLHYTGNISLVNKHQWTRAFFLK